jgi:hypothetical protein
MELVIKLYADKPSRIGIKYTYEYLAQRAYEDIMRVESKSDFRLKFEIIRDKLQLSLISEHSGKQYQYKDLEFRLDQLGRLNAGAPSGSPLIFVHLFPKENTLFVAKAFKKNEFINVTSYTVITADYSSNYF